MNLKKTRQLVLKTLYDVYQETPSTSIDVSDIIKEQGGNPVEIGKYLKDYGLVRNVQFKQERFIAQITLKGIEEIDPGYTKRMKGNVVSALGILGKSDLMEILEPDQRNNQKARDIATYLESINMIKQPVYELKEINVELSEKGRVYYDEIKPFSF